MFSKYSGLVLQVLNVISSILTWQPVLYLLFFLLGTYEPARKFFFEFLGFRTTQPYLFTFVLLLLFKGIKISVHTFSYYFLTAPARPAAYPRYSPSDVTVIVPTIGELDDEFEECIKSILANSPALLIIATVGSEKLRTAKKVCSAISKDILVIATDVANKREQFLNATSYVKTHITVYADDHVFWPTTFFRSALAPFEDPLTGIVGTTKRVRRDRSGGFLCSLLNYIACMYLERHNFECTASYNLDGGVFVISGRTALVLTSIIHGPDYRHDFLNETWFFGSVGPLKVDDDNFTTRHMVNRGFRTVFHAAPQATIETTLGTISAGGVTKFRGQLIRWVRTTWRSNSTSLFADRISYRKHPWTTYAMFFSSFVNFALFYDGALFFTLHGAGLWQHWRVLSAFVLGSKLIKPMAHLRKEPRDVFFLPFGLLFGYVHSGFKLWAMLTAGNIGWTGRQGIEPAGKSG